MFDLYIWDFDGTLFDTYPLIVATYAAELEKIGITETEEKIEQLVRNSFGVLHSYLSREYGLEEAFWKHCSAARRELELKSAFPFKGAFGFLSDVVSMGGKNAIFTHRGSESLFRLLEKAGMKKLFCDFITADDGFPLKPAPDAVTELLSRNGVSHHRAVMIGDREIDVLSGLSAGTSACLFRPLSFENTRAPFTASSFAQLRQQIM